MSQTVNNESGVEYFSQVLLTAEVSSTDLTTIQEDLNQNPSIQMARVDPLNKTVYIVTHSLNTYNRDSFESWIGSNSSFIQCYKQGIRGVDSFIPFDEHFCE
jgi:hypothetical protein